jgi:hypothetical protein
MNTLPLRHTIPLLLPFPVRGDHASPFHPLERIAEGSRWLEIGTDLLSTEALRMLPEQSEDRLA